MGLLEDIPISVWKTFSEIFPTGSNFSNCTEVYIDNLAKIIKSNSNFFVSNRDSNKTFNETQEISDIYKSLTTWFLGCTFRLLTFNDLSRKHDVLIDIQLCILQHLSKTALQVFHEMTLEYGNALHEIVTFVKSDAESCSLEIFVTKNHPKLDGIIHFESLTFELSKKGLNGFLGRLLQIVEYLLVESFDFKVFDSTCERNLEDLLFLMAESGEKIKMEISKIFFRLFKECGRLEEEKSQIFRCFERFLLYFEHIIYTKDLSSENDTIFEELLAEYLKIKNSNKISDFLARKFIEKNIQKVKTCNLYIKILNNADFEDLVKQSLLDFNPVIIPTLKDEILKEIEVIEGREIQLYKDENATKWRIIYKYFIKTNVCNENQCKFGNFLSFLEKFLKILIEIQYLNVKNSRKLIFFNNTADLFKIIALLNRHFTTCASDEDSSLIFETLTYFGIISNSTDVLLIVHDVLTFNFTNILLSKKNGENKYELTNLIQKVDQLEIGQQIRLEYYLKYLELLLFIKFEQADDLKNSFSKILKQISDEKSQILIITKLPSLLALFPEFDVLISTILLPLLKSSKFNIQKATMSILPQIICILNSNFTIRLQPDVKMRIYCEKCHNQLAITSIKTNYALASLNTQILQEILHNLISSNDIARLLALEALPACSKHLETFNNENVWKIWSKLCGDDELKIRTKFTEVCHEIVAKQIMTDKDDPNLLGITFAEILAQTKRALLEKNHNLQETLINTIEKIVTIQNVQTIPILKNLLYFIMFPTSRFQLIAINCFGQLAEAQQMSNTHFYKYYKLEICEIVAHLCSINQTHLNMKLEQSLNQVSHTFGYYNARDFLVREYPSLVPFFMSKMVHSGSSALLEDLVRTINIEIGDLLTATYGKIFLYAFLNEPKESFKRYMVYLERTTKMSGPALRKSNVWLILNELLLNFHEKQGIVLIALSLLAKEESTDCVKGYLSARLLGILKHFDLKLMATNLRRKETVLRSLAAIFGYLGRGYITQFRFKIIAMLRTHDSSAHPTLHCQVWRAFIQSCEVETIGPQLATIFVSLLPLLDYCAPDVNEIFRELIVDNEAVLSDFIKDLFFVEDLRIDFEVGQVIRKYVRLGEIDAIRTKIGNYLKYFTHETLEVRINSMKYLKIVLEKNRKQLDEIILGYNGIDSVIVELIDLLTAISQQESDFGLKQACAEVFGELGAVEPSHLPRRYSDTERFFTFFFSDHCFIVNALGELIKALQGEKNTVKMDRFGVAIQEILKNYDISPDASSAKNHLWRQFSEQQQEIMRPFLNSRYIIAQFSKTKYQAPIFGTQNGASYATWLHNWTCSLVSSLSQEHQSLITVCLPALKQDHRILMHYLPYILLHSLFDDYSNQESAFLEMQAVTSSFSERKNLNAELFDKRLYFVQEFAEISPETASSDDVRLNQSSKVVFIILDFLHRWLREWQWDKGQDGFVDFHYKTIQKFVNRFCKLELSKSNYHFGEYPRALMYLEDYITANPAEIDKSLAFLAQIYAQLGECDGVEGVMAIQQSEPSIEQRILALEACHKLADTASCYERMPQPLKLRHTCGLIQCYLDLDNANTALNVAKGALVNRPEFGNMLLEMQAEPLWRLGRYDDLDELLKKDEMIESNSWGAQFGAALLDFQNLNRDGFKTQLERLKVQQVEFLGGTSLENGVYQQGYEFVARLNAINELEQVENVTNMLLKRPNDRIFIENTIRDLAQEWDLRIKVVQESTRIIEPLLCSRRVALDQAKALLAPTAPSAISHLDQLLGECWLQSATIARTAGVPQQAYNYLLKAEEYGTAKLFLEKAKLHWQREEHEHALRTLKRGIDEIIPKTSLKDAINALGLEKKKICAEAKLLIATYNETMSNVDTETNVQHYKESGEVYKEWETNLVALGQYYDRIFEATNESERDNQKGSDLQIHMINYFGKSLQYGSSNVYQSMPRLLSIWLDYGTRLLDVTPNSVRDERLNNLLKMTKLIDHFVERLPSYVFLTAFSQLVSRICHPQRGVYRQLTSIIIKLLLKYPQQTLWMMISVIKSSYAIRAKRCKEIFNDPRLKSVTLAKLVQDFTGLAEKLIELCNKPIADNVTTVRVSELVRALPRMLAKSDFSQIMIPTHQFRKLVLPNPDFLNSQHNPFPNQYVHIVGIEEQVTVLLSLQRPRKITFRGSDGKCYIQMLKPKDDLRKDFRLMEFNHIVNHLLSLEPDARQRRLYIRLYSVAPLNEECGLIEWIPNLLGLRPILHSIYKQKGLGLNNREVKDFSCSMKDSLVKKREAFTKVFIVKHPPVLGDWFRRTFPDSQSWFFARSAYIRTTAVISMVGYILGLGDRHGENILHDSTNGDTVHVDFNCLFNKGETFEWPERVPFRLTHNMVNAMGPLGVEGVFRKSCACTLKVLRTNTNTLMSIVTPFVYDPLVSWSRKNASNMGTAEMTNEQAMESIKNIRLRLQGQIMTGTRNLSIPLSVDGQTNHLINEATSLDNLCQMYMGWGAYL